MSYGKMNTFIKLTQKKKVLDDEGFSTITDVTLAEVHAYRERIIRFAENATARERKMGEYGTIFRGYRPFSVSDNSQSYGHKGYADTLR